MRFATQLTRTRSYKEARGEIEDMLRNRKAQQMADEMIQLAQRDPSVVPDDRDGCGEVHAVRDHRGRRLGLSNGVF